MSSSTLVKWIVMGGGALFLVPCWGSSGRRCRCRRPAGRTSRHFYCEGLHHERCDRLRLECNGHGYFRSGLSCIRRAGA